MTVVKPRNFVLPPEQAQYVDELIESGRFTTDAEVIEAGLELLRDQDLDLEQWLREEVVPDIIAMELDPRLAIPAEQVFAELKARRAKQ